MIVTGQLAAADLRRLEHLCGPALEQRHLPLELDLSGVSTMDEPARLFLDHLARRGAVVSGGLSGSPQPSE
ncbi:MAG: hypothetical protein AB7U25_12480 [Vicinamibacterales bacterium]